MTRKPFAREQSLSKLKEAKGNRLEADERESSSSSSSGRSHRDVARDVSKMSP
jgi:hypothetical protein